MDVAFDEMRAQFDVNVFGLVDLTNRVVPQMKERGSGDIVNVEDGDETVRVWIASQGG